MRVLRAEGEADAPCGIEGKYVHGWVRRASSQKLSLLRIGWIVSDASTFVMVSCPCCAKMILECAEVEVQIIFCHFLGSEIF